MSDSYVPEEDRHSRERIELGQLEPMVQAGRIEGSIHIPLNTILAGATDQLDPGKTTVVVCRSGNRSELATLMLRARGFEAYNLEHGLEEWADQGRPLTTPDGAAGQVA